jgi:hypothetical protein
MRSFVSIVSSIARGLCLRDASILFAAAALGSLAGCSGGGSSTGGTIQTAPTITWPTPAAITYGTALSGTQLDATASVAGSFVYNPAAGTVPKAGMQTLSATFTPTDTTHYTTATASVQLTVNRAVPTVSAWPAASAITSGAALAASTLSGGSASVPGVFAWTNPSTVPAAGTDSESVTFTPSDAVDYTTVQGSVSVVVNPSTPQITGFALGDASSPYAVEDTFKSGLFLPWTVTGAGFASGDYFSMTFTTTSNGDGSISSYTSDTISGGIEFDASDFMPQPLTATDANANGKSNPWSGWFLGNASQSTLVFSATTGTAFHVEQATGQIYSRTTTGVTGMPNGSISSLQSPIVIAVDTMTGDVIFAGRANTTGFSVINQSGSTQLCYFLTPNVTLISSIAAMGGNIVATAPNENLVLLASLANCSGGQDIPYNTVAIAGQPWAVAMSGTDAYILSRDDAGKGSPRVTKINAASGAVEGFVDLTGIPLITSIRSTTQYEGIDQITAFNQTPVANVLYMSDATDAIVLTISTDTSNNKKMAVTQTTLTGDFTVMIAPQETGSVAKPILWVASLPTDGSNVVNVGALDPATGKYTPNVGKCPAGLVGGFAASVNGLQCSGVATISAPLALQYSSY